MKKIKFSKRLATITTVALMSVLPSSVFAAEYPEKPITAIVPFGAGGGTDSYARTLSSVAYDVLKQPIVVVNRPGGSGYVGGDVGGYASATLTSDGKYCVTTAGDERASCQGAGQRGAGK